MTEHRRRLVPDRFRRIWAIVQEIAQSPGQTRAELARKFHLSERQLQSDVNIIRTDMHLPLVRRQGYRFANEGATGAATCDLRDAQLMVLVLANALRDRSMPRERVEALAAKLPALFPAHLAPLVGATVSAAMSPRRGTGQTVFGAVSDALLRGGSVQLHYPMADAIGGQPAVEIAPELLIPYLDSWFVVGDEWDGTRRRSRMLRLADVAAVTAAHA